MALTRTPSSSSSEATMGTAATASLDSTVHKRHSSSGLRNGFRKVVLNFSKLLRHDSAQSGTSDASSSSASAPADVETSSSTKSQQSRTSSPLARSSGSASRVTTSGSPPTTPPSTARSAGQDTRRSSLPVISKSVASVQISTVSARGIAESRVHYTDDSNDDSASAASVREHNEQNLALAELERATAILEARHASLKVIPVDGQQSSKKLLTRAAKINPIVKVKESAKNKTTPSLVPNYSLPRAPQVQPTFQTANHAAAVMLRRDRVMNMAYGAVYYGCRDSEKKIAKLLEHFDERERSIENRKIDLIIGFGDYHFNANSLGAFERTWLQRYKAMCILIEKRTARVLGLEDYEQIIAELFPENGASPLEPENFDLFLEAIWLEGGLNKTEFLSIRDLGVTQEELEQGIRYNAPTIPPRELAQQPQNVRIFNVPRRKIHPNAVLEPFLNEEDKPHDYLKWYLGVLVEAAVYQKSFYRGYFFGGPVRELQNYLDAHKPTQLPESRPRDSYYRPWTYSESRMLQRGQLVCKLLKMYEEGTIEDFGVLRIVRATLVPIPAQPQFNLLSLEHMLYGRASSSRMPVQMIPEILALHPKHDHAFACPVQFKEIMDKYKATAADFEIEETVRLGDIEADANAYKEMINEELGVWGRLKRKAKAVLGRKKAVDKVFDPFSPEHGSCMPEGKDDGSFYGFI